MLIYWHKRDLRLLDNPALTLALDLCRSHDLVFLPIFGLETDLIESQDTGYEFNDFYKYRFISAAIPLFNNYAHFGINANLFYCPILKHLEFLNTKNKIKILINHQEHGTDATYARDKKVAKFCKNNNIEWIQIAPSGVVRNLNSRDGRDKLVKEYLNTNILPIPNFKNIKQIESIDNTPVLNIFENIKKQIGSIYDLQPTSEKSALICLESFTSDRASNYRGGISSPNKAMEFGSRLSQYLAFGSVSLKYVHQYFAKELKLSDNNKIKSGILGATQRLHWREHFIQRLETSPNMTDVAIHPDYNNIEYNNQYFDAYKRGVTGEPLIDACIRCLLATGFINFRIRALLVSYGVFGLDINWRDLGRFLATTFLDYEPGIHWSQIQMQAGITGINTIRVYSPHKQIIDQDPDCIFIKKWIPELSTLTSEQIQNYTKISLSELTNGRYPNPVVDFKAASKINKAKTYGIRSETTKESSQKVFIKHGSRKPRVKKAVIKKESIEKVIKKKILTKKEILSLESNARNLTLF